MADCSRYDDLRGGHMSIDRLAQLKALHLYGMATAWTELLAEREAASAHATQSLAGSFD